MNIFYLDHNPEIAARLHSDVHVIKMCLETAQILCAVMHRYGLPAPYRASHTKHPSVIWAGDSKNHYQWLQELGLKLCTEYCYRFGKTHACENIILNLPLPPSMPNKEWIAPPQVMPEEYRKQDSIEGYKNYYARAKNYFPGKGEARWTKRARPDFMPISPNVPS